MLVSPVTFNRLVLSSSSSRIETPPSALDNHSLNKKKCDFVVSATPSKRGGGGKLWRRNRQQRRNEDITGGYESDSEENEIAASGVVGHAVLAKIRGADFKEKGTETIITTPRTAKSKQAVPSSTTRTTTTPLNGSDVLMALLNSSNKTSNKKRKKGTRSTSYTKRGDEYTSSSEEEEDEENNNLMRPLHIKKEWGPRLDELGRSLEELVTLHDSR